MSFIETVRRARDLLREEGRITLRGLKREFGLDDDALGNLVEELVDAQQVAGRDGKVVVWLGAAGAAAGTELAAPRAVSPSAKPEAERRHLTVMFCDLVGSAGLTHRLGAEAYRQVVQAYQARSAEAIEFYGGHVAQYLGDGLLVYFGHPQAHEDDAERAVRAGREVLRELETLNLRLEAEHGVQISARVGIHTGPVVVGEMGSGERKETLALGDTPTIAARLQGVAEADTVVISAATLRLVAGLFVTEDRGTPALKGISQPIRVHRVLHPSGVSSRLDRAPTLSPFVGREQELGLLLDRWEQAQEMRGQAVLIAGEAGIGKSRLLHRLREQLRDTPHSWLECRCSPYNQNSAFYPVIELAEQGLRVGDVDPPEQKVSRLESALELAGFELAEAVPLFTSLLSLRLPERYAPLEVSPQLQRQKTLEAVLSWVLALGETQPVVLVVEDLHWVDPSTLEWLGLVIEQCPTAGVLLLLTFRPDFEPPWPTRAHLLPMGLNRLSHRQAKDLVEAAAGEALPEPLVDQLVARSDGIPLFVEELAKGVVESGGALDGSPSELAIPETLQDSLMARLDRLGDAKQVAQLGAVLGRDFPYALLKAVAPMKEVALREGLGRLVEAELAYQRGLPPKATYTFKHALVQDTAYQSLLGSQRRELHGRIVDVLAAELPEREAAEPELVAWHAEMAGRIDQAIAHYQRAAERADGRAEHEEALRHIRRGIGLAPSLPPERRREAELGLRLHLARVLGVARGFAHAETEQAWRSAQEFSQPGEWTAGAIAWGLANVAGDRANHAKALERYSQVLEVGQSTREHGLIVAGHHGMGIALLFTGRFTESLAALDQARSCRGNGENRFAELGLYTDPEVSVWSVSAAVLWYLGRLEQAASSEERALELARERSVVDLGFVFFWAALTALLRQDTDAACRLARRAVELVDEHGLHILEGRCRACLSVAEAMRSSDPVAVERLRLLAKAAETVSLAGSSWLLGSLASLQLATGRLSESLATVDGGLRFAARTGEGCNAAELHRLRGELSLRIGGDLEHTAESDLRRALEIARGQEARFLELRAAVSLARLWQRQDRKGEAHAILQPVYDWFTEGFDTADLKDAKALLDELA